MKAFESKYFPTIMYISLIIVSITILFSFASIIEKANSKTQIEKNSQITASVIENMEDIENKVNKSKNLYSYWIIILTILITIIIVRFIYRFL